MQGNTPPRDEQFSDYDFEDSEEIFEEVTDEDLNALIDQESAADDMDGVEEEGDEANADIVVFSKHKGSVFSCCISPSGNVGASGGEDDMAYVWELRTGNTIMECSGHKDSVTSVCFSHDGAFLATGDLAGLIQVWDISSKQRVWQFETDELNWLQWHSSSTVLFGGTPKGEVWMWLVPRGDTKTLSHAGSSAECGALLPDGKHFCVAYQDGSVKFIDLKTSQTLQTISGHGHNLVSLSVHPNKPIALCGSSDGAVSLRNLSSGAELAVLNCNIGGPSAEDEGEGSSSAEERSVVEIVTFCPTLPDIAVTATLSGVVTVWDISSQTSRHHIVQGCGTSSLKWIPDQPFFFTGGLDGVLRVFDARSASQLLTFSGHKASILSCDVSKDGSTIVTSSDDSTVRILHLKELWPNKAI